MRDKSKDISHISPGLLEKCPRSKTHWLLARAFISHLITVWEIRAIFLIQTEAQLNRR